MIQPRCAASRNPRRQSGLQFRIGSPLGSLIDLRALCKTFCFPVTSNLYSDFFFSYSGKRWPGCCAAQFRTPRGPALIPRETVGRTSEGGRSCGFPGKPRAGAR
jgi:hypothetical protein